MNPVRGVRRLPLTVQSAYSDLLARLESDSVLDLGGTPVRRRKGQRSYWYAVERVGDRTVERYLGPDDVAMRRRIEWAQQVREDLKQRERQRRPLVRMCREAGVPAVDAQTGKVLRALAHVGLFRLRGVLVGTHALRCYPGLLGVDFPEAHAATEDIDVAAFRSVSVAMDDRIEPVLGDALALVGRFVHRPGLHKPATAWRDADSGTAVELLTPNQGAERDTPVDLPALGAHATPIRFLDYLIHDPVPAALLYRSGSLVKVPRPARYAVHKLIVASRRHASAASKARKDVEQAAALIDILADDQPDDLADALAEALGRGPSWRTAVRRGSERLPAYVRARLESLPS